MKRHSTDLVSLAFGILFFGIAGWWLVGRYVLDVHLNVPNLGLIMAGALVVLGLLGVVGSLRREAKPARRDETDAAQRLTDPIPAASGVDTAADTAAADTAIDDTAVDDIDRPDTAEPDFDRVESDEVDERTDVADPVDTTPPREDRPY